MPATCTQVLVRTQFYLTIFGALYVAVIGLLAIPFVQSNALYLNRLRFPWFADFDTPEKYGLAPNKTLNFKLNTADSETLGAWFILSDSYYHSLPSIPSSVHTHVQEALQRNPTILFFHGNAATRAFSARVQYYTAFTSRLSANVLAVDYRGFAESSGEPSEAGLVCDARAAWDWLISKGAKQEDILIMGHSLGTGVTAQLGAQLDGEGINHRGLVLLSPFSSIQEVLKTYSILGVAPLLKPLVMFPWAWNLLTRCLVHRFDTLKVVPHIKSPVIIAHALDDWDIPYTHSEVIFDTFLKSHLPSIPPLPTALPIRTETWNLFETHRQAHFAKRKEIVTHIDMGNFGTIDEFEEGRKIMLVKTKAGNHDYLGIQEGLQDIIGKTFGLF